MINRKAFAAVQIVVGAVVAGVLLILLVAVPNVLRQTRNSSRSQDVHLLGLAVQDQLLATQGGPLPASCNNTQPSCFTRDAKLSFYDNTSSSDTVVTYYHNTKPFDKLSPQPDPKDREALGQVIIHSYAVCTIDGRPTGTNAGARSVVILYTVEAFSSTKLVCRSI